MNQCTKNVTNPIIQKLYYLVSILAVEGGSSQITDYLIQYGSDVNHYNKSRVYPLHSACTNGTLDIVKILVKVSAFFGVVVNLF